MSTVTPQHTFFWAHERRVARAARRREDAQLRRELESYRSEAERVELLDILRRGRNAEAEELLELVNH